MKLKSSDLDLLTATIGEVEAAMQKGVRAALRRQKAAGVSAIVWDDVKNKIVVVPAEEIPDFPEDDEANKALANPRGSNH